MNTLKFDNMIWALGSGNQTPRLDAESQQAMIKLVEVIDQLAPIGDDNRRDLWFSMPRATFEEYHRYHDDEDYTEEEIQSLYHSEYPDELCWYSLTSIHHHAVREEEFYAIFLNNRYILSINDSNSEYFPMNATEFIEVIKERVLAVIEEVKAGTYNDRIRKELPAKYKRGLILRKDYWDIYPHLREEYHKCFEPGEIEEFLRMASEKDLTARPSDCLTQMTARQFYDACYAGYKAIGYEPRGHYQFEDTEEEHNRYGGASAKETYYMYADGRDDGLLNVPIDDPDAFASWMNRERPYYEPNGSHPWEVVTSMSISHSIHLYVTNHVGDGTRDSKYHFALAGGDFSRSPETIEFFLGLYHAGLPVRLIDADSLVARLQETDEIGIISEFEKPWYRTTVNGVYVEDLAQLSDEDKPELIAKKVKWESIPECSLL